MNNTLAIRDDLAVKLGDYACRFCHSQDLHTFVDLGMSPLCESFVTAEDYAQGESFYPLHALVCGSCFLVQVPEIVSGTEIYGGEYAYFSSFSDSWLRHAADYARMITERLQLGRESLVIELASNDGYLLKNFVAAGIPCLGIEPADNIAAVAMEKGVPTRNVFFGTETARQLVADGMRPHLLVANNVIGHVPDINDFVAGYKILLHAEGVATVEIPHLLHLVQGNQFDTIYQEHYCYYSLLALQKIFAYHGLTLFDVEKIPTHGGSLRYYFCHAENQQRTVRDAVHELARQERDAGYEDLEIYRSYKKKVIETKYQLLEFLVAAKRQGKTIAGYGAPGKASTLLNYCGVREDFIDYVVDRNPYKHGRFLPGVRIPIHAPEKLAETKPDLIMILPWNLKDEIVSQLEYTRAWGAQLFVPIPEVSLC